ncbi:MAG TPA: Gfo/Idh/MocA family oxidoreductase [Vicinamibacteria bacterium]
MTFHVGLIGAGTISRTHGRAATELPGVEVVAVVGTNREKTAALAAEHGAAAYGALDEFLRHRPMEAVLIGSPSGVHADEAIAAARAGLHVLCEKPLDVTTERVDAMVAEADKAGVKLGVMFQDRTKPDLRRLKALIDGGGLGRPLLVSGRVRWWRPPEYYASSRWRGTWALDGGGALMNQGVHTVDLMLWLLGDVRWVSARTATTLHKIEVEDTAVAVLEFASGAVGTLEATTTAYPGYPRRLDLTGSEGTVIVENDRIVAADLRTPLEGGVSTGAGDSNRLGSTHLVTDVSGHRALIEDFRRAVETGGRPVCDGRDGRRSVELVQAVYRSSREGAPVLTGTSPAFRA